MSASAQKQCKNVSDPWRIVPQQAEVTRIIKHDILAGCIIYLNSWSTEYLLKNEPVGDIDMGEGVLGRKKLIHRITLELDY